MENIYKPYQHLFKISKLLPPFIYYAEHGHVGEDFEVIRHIEFDIFFLRMFLGWRFFSFERLFTYFTETTEASETSRTIF